ncbi:hypothetical protein D3C84_1009080 [compost metagenome]
MAGFKQGQSFVDVEIISRTGFDRECSADQLASAVVTCETTRTDVATEVVADMRRDHFLKSFYERPGGQCRRSQNA